MLSRDQVLKAAKAGRKSKCLDGRDYSRLTAFFPPHDWKVFGFTVIEGTDPKTIEPPKEWTEAEIIKQLRDDVAFGFKKALGHRGISSSMMHDVVLMWLWVLEHPLQHHEEYAMYGLPLFKKVALAFGFENPIGDDNGNEQKYDDE